MSLVQTLGLRALHRLDPERAHDLSIRLLERGLVPLGRGPVQGEALGLRLAGLDLANPVGLAAGFDKNARAVPALMRAGFGFLEVGAATPRPQPGNPRPRLFRLPEDRAIINRFGFNNEGAAAIARRLAARPATAPSGVVVPVGLNIGANKDSPDRAADFAAVVAIAGRAADFLTVNVSSPNTERLRDLQGPAALALLLDGVLTSRNALPRRPPVFLKIAPDLDQAALADIAAVALAAPVDGVIATNTTLARDGLRSGHAGQAGGLSGAPLRDRSTRVLARMARQLGGRIPLIGVGGIASATDAWDRIAAGASAVQIYTALIYQGFSLVRQICQELDDRLRRERMTLAELSGSATAAWL